jgi:hypothetical protein
MEDIFYLGEAKVKDTQPKIYIPPVSSMEGSQMSLF